MKFLARSLAAAALAALLSACGGSDPTIESSTIVQTAGAMQAVEVPAQAAVQGTPPTYGPNQPQPDCAPEGCNGLRIIDANAEAYRLEAMQRAALESAQPQA